MNYEEHFYDEIFHLTLINRIKFFLYIWNDGAFQSTLEKVMQLSTNDSSKKETIEKYAEQIQKLGFLTIVQRKNPANIQIENFYLVSDENFKNIFVHLCNSAHLAFDNVKFNLVFNDRKNIIRDMIEDIQVKLKNDKLLQEKKLIILLNKNFSFFFLFIMKFSSIMSNKDDELFHFYNEVTVRLSVPTDTLVSRNVWDLINIQP